MNDLISRQAAINECNKEGAHGYISAYELSRLPSAQKHGKWEYIGGYGFQYRCSNCIKCAEYKTPYCPNCGAIMDVERSEG